MKLSEEETFKDNERYEKRNDSFRAENEYIEQIEQNTNQEFDVKNMLKAQIDYEFSKKRRVRTIKSNSK